MPEEPSYQLYRLRTPLRVAVMLEPSLDDVVQAILHVLGELGKMAGITSVLLD